MSAPVPTQATAVTDNERVVVAGAGIAGVRVVRELREAGFAGEIVLAGAERHLPYDRPPLSKQLLDGRFGPNEVTLTDTAEMEELDVTLLSGRPLNGVDPRTRRIRRGQEQIGYDRLIVATGADPRPLPFPVPPGTRTLRTLDDSLALRNALPDIRDLVVIGGGLIAFEIASVAATAGVCTTVVEALDAPLVRSLGTGLGRRWGEIAASHGVTIRCPARVTAIKDSGHITGVLLDDGTRLPADHVVSAIGAVPAVDWLAGSGLPSDAGGLRADTTGAIGSDGRIWAVGDVAAWYDPVAGKHVRREHWTSAVEQARTVARNLTAGAREPLQTVPYFWSDQFGHKIQGFGSRGDGGTEQVVETPNGQLALFTHGASLTGAVAVDQPRLAARLRRLVRDRQPASAALELLPASSAHA